MHIFCDESGGTDAASKEFLVSAVLIDPTEAGRLMRQFRKKAKPNLSHEIKGHQLNPTQRALFFRLLSECGSFRAAVAFCRRSDEAGGWAMRTLTEAEIWVALAVEAISVLGPSAATGVTVDRGRFSKERLAGLCREVSEKIAGMAPIKVQSGGSDHAPGLQVADIVVNTACHRNSGGGVLAAELLNGAGVALHPLRLNGRAPAWLSADA